jgi:protein phosphatase
MGFFEIVPCNAQHQGSRGEQQDAFAFSDPKAANAVHAGFLAMIADGMGGMTSGREASRAATRAFLENYAAKTPEEPIFDALRRAAFRANEAVLEIGGLSPGSVGTTLAAVAVHEDMLYWLSVGDSRVYILDAGSITQLNDEHNLKSKLRRLARRGLAGADEAERHPQSEALTSYIGIEELTEIDASSSPLRIKGGDQVILCTDGLYRTLSEDEIFETARRAFAGDAARLLVEKTIEKRRPNQDNVTVVALSFRLPPEASSPEAENGSALRTGEFSRTRAQAGEHAAPAGETVTLKPGAFGRDGRNGGKKKILSARRIVPAFVAVAVGVAAAVFWFYLREYFGGGK